MFHVKSHLSGVPVKPDSLPSLSSSFYFHPCVSYSMNFNIFTLLVLSLFLIFSQPCHTAFRIFFLQSRMEPMPLASEAQSLHHWTSREVPTSTSPSCVCKAKYGLFVCNYNNICKKKQKDFIKEKLPIECKYFAFYFRSFHINLLKHTINKIRKLIFVCCQ